mgnify:CR=1 FL=1
MQIPLQITLRGMVCGTCDNPYTMAALDDFEIRGDTLTFNILHEDFGSGDTPTFSRPITAHVGWNEMRYTTSRPAQPSASGTSPGASLLGLVIGFLAIRRQGIYSTMITLALSQIVYFLAVQFRWTGGEDGLQGIPRGTLLGLVDLSSDTAMYYVALALFAAGFLAGAAHPLHLGLTDEIPFLKKQERLTFARCGITDPLSLEDYEAHGGLKGLRKALDMTPAAVVQEVTDSGLRGRGGAGTGRRPGHQARRGVWRQAG